jgi:hypothetical protein
MQMNIFIYKIGELFKLPLFLIVTTLEHQDIFVKLII